MSKFLFSSLLAVSLCSTAVMAEEMTGYISDAHCGAKHDAVSEKNTKCVVDTCIKGGADPVLVKDGKVMKFDDASKKMAVEHAGQMVKINGTMDGDTVKISSIENANAK